MTDKREALLNSALELFSSRGYENTPTSLISKNAGVATGTLFHHFGSKEELINQLYIDCKFRMMSSVEQAITGKATGEERIRAAWEVMISWGIENEERFLFIMQHKQSSFIKEETRREIEAQSDELTAFAGEIHQTGLFSDAPVELTSELASALMEGTISYFRKNPEQFDDAETREIAYRIFRNAFTG